MKRRFSSLAAIALLLVALPAAASTFVNMTPRQLSREADAVVVGRVLQTHSYWNEDASMILTDVSVAVDETIRGEAPGVVHVRTYGGTVGNFMIEAHGFPEFTAGERVLLFLQADDEDGSIRVLGYRQGLYRIARGPDGSEIAVPSVEPGVRYLNADGSEAPAPRAVRLREFRSFVRVVGHDPNQ
jgi:hypothetical protein